ncbi:MAG: response regulator [Flavobacteriales bacterium]|nr:response regulator [Flavobacteriales bacterium]
MNKVDRTREGVLIIDDERDVCFLLCTFLRSNGYRADYCTSLADCMKLVKSRAHDIILLDINLKDGNGLSLLQEHEIADDVRVIVMSAHENKENRAKALGADAFIPKPFSIKQVIDEIDTLRKAG